jgi:acyl transferase
MMNELLFEQHETTLGEGKRMVIWTLRPTAEAPRGIPVVLGSGFAQRMHHASMFASYGAYNGLFVTRYDPINHVGLSEGDMEGFTLTDSLESLRAAVDWTCEHTKQPKVIVVATSLTARVAFELATQTDRIALIVSAVGVVNVRSTLARVFEEDWSRFDPETLTGVVSFEGKEIGKRGFACDAALRDWWSLERCIEVLGTIEQPIVSFIGSEDEWVDAADVRRAFAEGANGPRKLLLLERASHDLRRDPAVGYLVVQRVIEEVLRNMDDDVVLTDPKFEDMVEQALLERRIQRGSSMKSSVG